MSKVLMVHGYLLSGTGSNLYVRNIVKKMCELGQDVILVCQEFDPENYDFIARCYRAKDGEHQLIFERETPYLGKCDIYIPDINNELLVYVWDRYRDLHVVEMKNATHEQIQSYLEGNAQTINYICSKYDISHAYSNHLVLQPQYVARGIAEAGSQTKQIIIGHGSDLNYAISQSDYIKELARKTLASCDQIVAVSHHSKQLVQDTFPDLCFKSCEVISVGLDEQLFVDMTEADERSLIEGYFAQHDKGLGFSSKQACIIEEMVADEDFDFEAVQASYEPKDIEVGCIDSLLKTLYEQDGDLVVYLGKYLEQKGLIPLLLSIPLVLADNPQAQFVMVGFGALRAQLQYLSLLIQDDKLETLVQHGSKLGLTLEADKQAVTALMSYLSDPARRSHYRRGSQLLSSQLLFTGYLDQKIALRVLKQAQVSIFPSILPEAFGMVIIEAMAAQSRPLVTDHSGFAEVLNLAQDCIPGLDTDGYRLPLDDQLIFSIAEKTQALLAQRDSAACTAMSEFALQRYGWEGITKSLLDL